MAEFPYDPAYGEAYNCRERRFAAAIGRDAGWLHAGRPRREAVRIALRLRLRRDVADLVEAAAAFVAAVAQVADAQAETLMADQTYLQHAQPSTFGHYLLRSPTRCCATADRLLDGPRRDQPQPRGRGLRQRQPAARRPRPAPRRCSASTASSSTPATRCGRSTGSPRLVADAAIARHHPRPARRGPGDLGQREFDYVDLADGYTRRACSCRRSATRTRCRSCAARPGC